MNRNFRPRQNKPLNRINHFIQAKELRVLDADGKQIGILSREEALNRAGEEGVDLVEIAPQAVPPVAKIIDYQKFLYQLKKKKQEEKRNSHVSETKTLQFRPFIDEHDLEVKLKKAREFLADGDKVKAVVKFRGRELGYQHLGREVMNKIVERLAEAAKVEREAKMEGRQMIMVLSRGIKQVHAQPVPGGNGSSQSTEQPKPQEQTG